jgi:hypothetical protein
MSISRSASHLAAVSLALALLACNAPGVGQTPTEPPPLAAPSTAVPTASVAPTPSGPLPDLVIEIIGIDSATIRLGVEPWTWLHYRVSNVGQVATSIQPRAGSMIDGQPPSGYLQVEGTLAPGASFESSFAVGHDDAWSVGTHSVVLVVDQFEEVAETDERNNQSAAITFAVVAP